MRKFNQQSGFAALELILVLVMVVAAAYTAWWVYERQHIITANSITNKPLKT